LLQPFDIRRRQLRPIDLERELVERAGKFEWDLVILGHWGAGIGADVEVLVPLHNEWNGMRHSLPRQ
jgi:hypothetical protein